MTGAELSKELTRLGREVAGREVFIDTGKGTKAIGEVDYDEKACRFVIVPVVKAMVYGKKGQGGGNLPAG